MTGVNLRQEISDAITAGNGGEAFSLIVRFWDRNPDSSAAQFVLASFEKLDPQPVLSSCRVAILRSFTLEPCLPLFKAAAVVRGINLDIYVSDFNAYAQDILDPESRFFRSKPDIVVLAVQTRDIAPELWNDFADLSIEQVEASVERVKREIQNLVRVFRSRSLAHLVIHNLEMPAMPNRGLLDCRSEGGQLEALGSINRWMLQLAREISGVYVFDYDGLVSRYGRMDWHDEGKWLTMRMPVAADHLVHLADEWLRYIHPLVGRVCKVLVTDLDNTLWGGVIGEEGFSGIRIGQDYPGASYQKLQRVMLDLQQRGIILAVCSKNNTGEAMEAIERHPGMLLRSRHFAAVRINWTDKVQNLREIAKELNVGTEALAFLDDNPAECHRVRSSMPEVTVIELPADPMKFALTLRSVPVFERLMLSAEDQQRGRFYGEQRLRAELGETAASREDFYRSLNMEVEIMGKEPEILTRVAQLTQKTNQFNMTGKKYTEQQLTQMIATSDWRIYAMRVRDRFGDNGIVGVGIVQFRDLACEIDTFLLSCRVIGRTVETALLSHIAGEASNRGFRKLSGWFMSTAKNAPAKDFYASHGFRCILEEAGRSHWEFDLNVDQRIAMPLWIRLISPAGQMEECHGRTCP
ncbi:MAG: hypothetical protein C0402_06695 [Thermodesulfovibrio sp.]|nr:hypothetical protein [Thermodesulfovibrio sp.]